MRLPPQSLHVHSNPGMVGRRLYSPQRSQVAPIRVIAHGWRFLFITVPEEDEERLSNTPSKHDENEKREKEDAVSDEGEVQANLSSCLHTEQVRIACSMNGESDSAFFRYSVIFKEPEVPHSGHFMSGIRNKRG